MFTEFLSTEAAMKVIVDAQRFRGDTDVDEDALRVAFSIPGAYASLNYEPELFAPKLQVGTMLKTRLRKFLTLASIEQDNMTEEEQIDFRVRNAYVDENLYPTIRMFQDIIELRYRNPCAGKMMTAQVNSGNSTINRNFSPVGMVKSFTKSRWWENADKHVTMFGGVAMSANSYLDNDNKNNHMFDQTVRLWSALLVDSYKAPFAGGYSLMEYNIPVDDWLEIMGYYYKMVDFISTKKIVVETA